MGILVKSQFEDNIQNMIDNYQSIEYKNGVSLRDINSILNAKWKVKIDKIVNFINLYNSLYQKSFELEDMFNTQYIKDYISYKNKIRTEYREENNSSFLDILFITLRNFWNKINDFFDKMWFDVKVKNRSFWLIILFIIITFITIFNIYNIIWNTDTTESVFKIEKITK